MDERQLRFRVAVVVLAVMICLVILVMLFSENQPYHRQYTVYVHFEDAPGVTRDTPVRKSGILIGRVTDVRFADTDPRKVGDEPLFPERDGVNVTLGIDSNRELHSNEICRIETSFLGDAVLTFVPSSARDPGELIQDGDRMRGVVLKNPLETLVSLEHDLRRTVVKVGDAGQNFGELSQQISDLVTGNDDQMARIVKKTEQALDEFRQATVNANKILGDDEIISGLKKTLQDVPAILADTRDALSSVRGAADAAQNNLKNLERFTEPLGQNGPDIAENINSSVERLDQVLENLVGFTEALDDENGTLGKLIHDPELYDRVLHVVRNVEDVTCRLKPIVNDARVAMDKVARNPGEALIGGALKRKAPIK